MPLAMGYTVLALAIILVCVNATSLFLAHQRLQSLADAAALAGASRFTFTVEDGVPAVLLTDEAVGAHAQSFVDRAGRELDTPELVVDEAGSPDGRSARVALRSTWRPLLVSAFVPDGVTVRATATSRTVLG